MVKSQRAFACTACGSSSSKWSGKCEACGEWNTLEEASMDLGPSGGLGRSRYQKSGLGKKVQFVALTGEAGVAPRWPSGNKEFDRVTGGGLVPGSAVLIGGDPGIGKSTLLLQVCAALARVRGPLRCAYISGEEAVDQVRMRAKRLGVEKTSVELASATSVRAITEALSENTPDVVVIDSIQTLYVDTLDSAPGTVSQVRASAQELIQLAKQTGFALILVGHVTKEGMIAGPKVVEHMVDAVLYFEGDRGHQFRLLRAIKNRFGPAAEIGVYEMQVSGLVEVSNPSALFLSERRADVAGAAVFAGMEGTRPVLVEIQALVSNSVMPQPRRAVVGWDNNRLSMILAVLEARCGVSMAGKDVFLNVAGGMRILEPAADLAVASALLSSMTEVPVPPSCVVFGEVGLSGEVRTVAQSEARIAEADKLGFTSSLMPPMRTKQGQDAQKVLKIHAIENLSDLVAHFARRARELGPAQGK